MDREAEIILNMEEFPAFVDKVLRDLKNDSTVKPIWFVGSRPNHSVNLESDWDFLVFCKKKPNPRPRVHEKVDIIRVGPSGCLRVDDMSAPTTNIADWNWKEISPTIAEYTGKRPLYEENEVRNTFDPLYERPLLKGYLV